uniref:Growth hormone receptor n=2 Tax=Macrostomum lignano TaxID=282301 RepID=A0A1I8HMB0_9PLAT
VDRIVQQSASSAPTLTSADQSAPAAAAAAAAVATASAGSENSNRRPDSSNDSSDLVKVDSVCDSAEIVSNNSDSAVDQPSTVILDTIDDSSPNPSVTAATQLLADPSYYSLMPASNTDQSGQSQSPGDVD